MTTFKTSPCDPSGAPSEGSPFILVEQTGGETYMGERRFVIHRDEVDGLVAALKAAR